MIDFYEEYLTRLRKRRQETPYRYYAQSQIRSLAPAFTELRNEYGNRLRRQELPETLAQDYALKSTQGVAEQYRQIYSEAEQKDMQRKREITGKIDEVELQKEIYEEKKKEEEQRKKDAFWKGILQVGGTIGGAALGTLLAPGAGTAAGAAKGSALGAGVSKVGEAVGGGVSEMSSMMSMLTGAQLGSGVGTAIGGFVGDEVSLPEIQAGLGGAISGLSSIETLKTEQANLDWLSGLDFKTLTNEDIQKIILALSVGMPLSNLSFK